jgi:hypothetical protein
VEQESEYFDLLKKEVAAAFRKSFPYCTNPIEEWKGQEIADFQEELLRTVKGRISEKWFYTHIKSKGEKLPRIDMLNMLSRYAGYRNWNEFVSKKKGLPVEEEAEEVVPEREGESPDAAPAPVRKRNLWLYLLIGAAVLVAMIALNLKLQPPLKTYKGHLIDITGAIPADPAKIEVVVFKDKESPLIINCDSTASFKIESQEGKIKFLVRSPYYSTDTITRLLNTPGMTENIRVRTDDYALMIHYFSTSNINDWKKRRTQLDDMIMEDAKIYQVFENSIGMELYNKDEFVNRLTMPLKSLKNIEIIETNYVNGRIKALKFKLNTKNAH